MYNIHTLGNRSANHVIRYRVASISVAIVAVRVGIHINAHFTKNIGERRGTRLRFQEYLS